MTKAMEILLQLTLLLIFLSFAYGASPQIQTHGRIMGAIRDGNLNDFNQELMNHPGRFTKFKPSYMMMAFHSWTQDDSDITFERELICGMLLIQMDNKNQIDGYYTPLICAVLMNSKLAVRKTIGLGADVNGRNKRGETALIVAICAGALRSAEELFEHGVDVDMVTDKGKTALQCACKLNNQAVREKAIMLLLKNWATVHAIQSRYHINYDQCDFRKIYDENDPNAVFNADEMMLKRMEIQVKEMITTVMLVILMLLVCGCPL